MPGPAPAVAAVRVAVRRSLREHCGPDDLALVGCSGGPDSLALVAAACFEARSARPAHPGLRVGAVIVDHGLQPGSGAVAERAAQQCRQLGAEPVEVVAVTVTEHGEGPEAAARAARYAALEAAAGRHGARVVLLGHTLDDQAEQLLLGLARGSGARSLAGMPSRRGIFVRPLLDLPREVVHAAAQAQGLQVWHDPTNDDPRYARTRTRNRVLPVLEAELGPGVAAALARSADQFREDAEVLDELAAQALAGARDESNALVVAGLTRHPDAIRRRALRRWLLELGCPPTATGRVHVLAVDALLTHWRGQRAVDLPGGVGVARRSGRLVGVR